MQELCLGSIRTGEKRSNKVVCSRIIYCNLGKYEKNARSKCMMKKKVFVRVVAILLAMSLTGCAVKPISPTEVEGVEASTVSPSQEEVSITTMPTEDSTENTEEQTSSPSSEVENVQAMVEPTAESTPEPTPTPSIVIPEEEKKDEYGMTEQQRNSFSMLYYLAITAEEIRISKDNRLILEDIYTSLLNDINPGSIDETT